MPIVVKFYVNFSTCITIINFCMQICLLVTKLLISLSKTIRRSNRATNHFIWKTSSKNVSPTRINQIKRLLFIMILPPYNKCIATIIKITASENDCS